MTRKEQMLAMYCVGKTLQEIGDEFGVCRERVGQIIRDDPRYKPRRVKLREEFCWTPGADAVLEQQYLVGKTYTAIAREMREAYGTVITRNMIAGRLNRLRDAGEAA